MFTIDRIRHLQMGGLPVACQELIIGVSFNQSLEKVSFFLGLPQLTSGVGFNRSLEKGSFLIGLEQLVISVSFNQSLAQASFLFGSPRS